VFHLHSLEARERTNTRYKLGQTEPRQDSKSGALRNEGTTIEINGRHTGMEIGPKKFNEISGSHGSENEIDSPDRPDARGSKGLLKGPSTSTRLHGTILQKGFKLQRNFVYQK
jgi:hypothetical protein